MISATSLRTYGLRFVAVASLALTLTATARPDDDTKTLAPIAPPHSLMKDFSLKLHHLHTGESISVTYKQGSQYVSNGIGDLNHFLRDHRTEDVADYDPREFDLLHALLAKLGRPNATIDIVCGYRTPESNNFLRTRSTNAADTGVAEHSQHMLSKAIDIRISGVSTRKLRDAALSLGMGGVGYYPPASSCTWTSVRFGNGSLAGRRGGRLLLAARTAAGMVVLFRPAVKQRRRAAHRAALLRLRLRSEDEWSGRQDSNLRPHPPQGCALPG